MKETEKNHMTDAPEEITSDTAKRKPSGAAIPDELSETLAILRDSFGIKGSTPGELVRSLRRRSARAAIENRARAEMAEKRYRSAMAEAEELKTEIEGFRLEEELKDPVFKTLVRSGFDLRAAYRFAHFDELMEKTRISAEQAGYEKAVALLRRGMLRPEENGTREQSGITEKKNVNALSGKGIRSILSRVEKGAKIKF